MDTPHNNPDPAKAFSEKKTLQDAADTPTPPAADSQEMLSPELEAINDLLEDPTLIDERTTPEAKLVSISIPGYAIKSILGAGGMGTVYRAVQDSPQRLVALKVIRPGLASPNMLRRFSYESEALGRLQHECIGRIYDAGTTDDGSGAVPWFAMELIEDGLNIRDYVQQYRLTIRERLALFGRVCEGVHHGHQKGIIHRDLKPDNIIVTPEGVPKIIDFGVARSTDVDVGVSTDRTDAG
ncbi:MAG: serine/threonine-protein kinase, partial [Phycisphaerales bacterium]|nr:serine/threonine-protein kinase [Phycisphaerales bacterium]